MLNRENNYKHIYKKAAKMGYTNIFTSFEVTFSKKYKKNTLDNFAFTDRLYLLAINEIHLVDQ